MFTTINNFIKNIGYFPESFMLGNSTIGNCFSEFSCVRRDGINSNSLNSLSSGTDRNSHTGKSYSFYDVLTNILTRTNLIRKDANEPFILNYLDFNIDIQNTQEFSYIELKVKDFLETITFIQSLDIHQLKKYSKLIFFAIYNNIAIEFFSHLKENLVIAVKKEKWINFLIENDKDKNLIRDKDLEVFFCDNIYSPYFLILGNNKEKFKSLIKQLKCKKQKH